MNRRATPAQGAPGLVRGEWKSPLAGRAGIAGRGFTLLEMCLVLFIIALLGGAMLPAIESAFSEQGLRDDSHQLALMVKTAMIKSSEQHRPYAIDASADSVALHPVEDATEQPAPAVLDTDAVNAAPQFIPDDVTASAQFATANKLLGSDPTKPDSWIPLPPTTWTFAPGEICAAPRVRMTRGEAWLEMSFDPLTGDVQDETAYFP